MDIVTLAMAKAYSDSKGGYTKPGKVYTFDGNLDGKESYEVQQNFYMVKVSDEVCDLNSIEEIVLLSSMNGSKTFKKKDITVGIDAGVLATIVNGVACVFSANEGNEAGYPKGTFILYISYDEHYEYVSKIQFAETIVPIDPKFLTPMGGGLPVVKLTTEPAADGVRLTDEESAAIRAAWTDGLPAVISFAYYGTPVSGVFSYFSGVYTMTSFEVNFSVEDTDGGNLTFSVIEP